MPADAPVTSAVWPWPLRVSVIERIIRALPSVGDFGPALLLSLILRKPAFGFRTPAFEEVLCPIERGVLRAELRERVGFHRIDVLVRGRQRRLDRQRRARGDLACDRDAGVE